MRAGRGASSRPLPASAEGVRRYSNPEVRDRIAQLTAACIHRRLSLSLDPEEIRTRNRKGLDAALIEKRQSPASLDPDAHPRDRRPVVCAASAHDERVAPVVQGTGRAQADHATAPDVAAGVDPAVADELCGERLRADVLHLAGDLDLLGLLRLLDLAGDPGVAPRATAWAGGAARALSPLRSLGSGLRCGQPAHEVVTGVGDEHVAPRLIDRHAEGPEQLRTSPRPAVAAERTVRAGGAVAGDRRDRPARRQLADLALVGVGDVDVARAVDSKPGWK